MNGVKSGESSERDYYRNYNEQRIKKQLTWTSNYLDGGSVLVIGLMDDADIVTSSMEATELETV